MKCLPQTLDILLINFILKYFNDFIFTGLLPITKEVCSSLYVEFSRVSALKSYGPEGISNAIT